MLGYAYPVSDSDGDTLWDGLEHLMGTSTTDADSDDDGLGDGVEFPLTQVQISDPCAGPNITCTRQAPQVFANGFE